LGVSLNGAVRGSINSREVLNVSKTRGKRSILSIVWGIIRASDTIVDVLAEVGSIGSCRVADFKTELISTHEIVPFNNLFESVIVAAPCSRVNQPAKRVATKVSAVGVKLTAEVVRGNVDEALIDESNNLDVSRSSHELHTIECTRRDDPSATAGFGAPSDLFTFSVPNS